MQIPPIKGKLSLEWVIIADGCPGRSGSNSAYVSARRSGRPALVKK
jgi:hypothetical protein